MGLKATHFIVEMAMVISYIPNPLVVLCETGHGPVLERRAKASRLEPSAKKKKNQRFSRDSMWKEHGTEHGFHGPSGHVLLLVIMQCVLTDMSTTLILISFCRTCDAI